MTGTETIVPFLEMVRMNAAVREELDLAWKSVLSHGRYVGGPEVDTFEREFARYCTAQACVGVANGTDALELILTGLGIGTGDEVIVPGNTFIATAEAVYATGARPRFVDVSPDTLLIDPDAAAAAVTHRTAAIIGVHLYGQLVDVDRLCRVAERHRLALIEDAAQAHGADDHGRRAGSVGIAAAFSFYPGKNLGALGDGGAVVTSDPELATRVRSLANHGRSAADRHRHDRLGRNSRLDTLQAAVLLAKLPGLDAAVEHRRAVMARYRTMLPAGCVPLAVRARSAPSYHLAVVRLEQRRTVTDALDAAGIGWGVHYPVPCHQQAPFGVDAEPLPVVEHAAGRILSLPISPTLSTQDVDYICRVLRGCVTR